MIKKNSQKKNTKVTYSKETKDKLAKMAEQFVANLNKNVEKDKQ